MTEQEHLLSCLSEECVEVAQRVSKILRFGMPNIDPAKQETNETLLVHEFNDVLAVVEMLIDDRILPMVVDRARIEEKKKKVRRFMDYARERGVLS